MEQKRKNRSTGFFRSKGFRFVILPFIAAALIFGVIAFIKSTMNAGKLTDFSRMTEDNCIYNGSVMFCYSGGYLKYMGYNLKEVIANKPSRFTAGHRMCAGCGAPPVARMIMRALSV